MKKVLLITITLILIFGSFVNAFADTNDDVLARLEELKKQIITPSEELTREDMEELTREDMEELIRRKMEEAKRKGMEEALKQIDWNLAFSGVGETSQKKTLSDGTISEVFPGEMIMRPLDHSGKLNGDNYCIDWWIESSDAGSALETYNLSLTGDDSLNISKLKIVFDSDVYFDEIYTDAGKFDINPEHDNIFTVIIENSGVHDLNCRFVNGRISRVQCINVEYKYDDPEAQNTASTSGSVLSGGSLTIVVGIACFAVGFLLATIFFRKKQNGKIIN